MQALLVVLGAGLLIEFLPVDLAIVLVLTAALQTAIWGRIAWHYLRRRR